MAGAMTPVIEKDAPKMFGLLVDGIIVRVKADTISEPADGRQKRYTFKLDGEVVGRFERDAVQGWWVEDPD